MGADVPKQFLPVGGKPVLMRTIERFRAYDKGIRVILVLAARAAGLLARIVQKVRFHRRFSDRRRWQHALRIVAEWPCTHPG